LVHPRIDGDKMETLLDLQEIAWRLSAAESVEERRALYALLESTETGVDSEVGLDVVAAA